MYWHVRVSMLLCTRGPLSSTICTEITNVSHCLGLETISFSLHQIHTASLSQSWVCISIPLSFPLCCSVYTAFGVHISLGIFECVCVHMKSPCDL